MEIEWLVVHVSAIVAPTRAESQVFWAVFDVLWQSWTAIIDFLGGTLWSVNLILNPKNIVLDGLMKFELLVTRVTVIGRPTKAESGVFELFLQGFA